MNSDFFDLSEFIFTRGDDVVNPGQTIYNPATSTIRGKKGDDLIIGSSSVSYGLGVSIQVAAEEIGQGSNPVNSVEFINQARLNVSGIINRGEIYTNRGMDIVSGSATAEVTAVAQTVSEAIAIANNVDATAMANSLASVEITAITNGINNSGKISTGWGSDTVAGEVIASVGAVATASINVAAIVNVIAQAPMSEALEAVAAGFATSLASSKVIARGINNKFGEIATNSGADKISAIATSYSATYAQAQVSVFTSAPPENQALALGVVEAIAKTEDVAIAIDNEFGNIRTGHGADIIEATGNASDNAIGIFNKYGFLSLGIGQDMIEATGNASKNAIGIFNKYGDIRGGDGADTIKASANTNGKGTAIFNQQGDIRTGLGDDTIEAYATGSESYGIYGGYVNTGYGDDTVKASSFAGGVNINMGFGMDYVEGFGEATVNGGGDFDTLSLGSYNKSDFNIQTHNGLTVFELDGTIMATSGFEKYVFADGDYSSHNLIV
ncbi:MAG: hypothetical protein AAFW70_13115 [Cyanobacteria bacterium J06635_10]